MKAREKIIKLVTDSVLIALYVVLSFVTLDLWTMRISADSFPVIVAALLFGPVDGIIVGLLGSFIDQMLTYGITVTTVLWMLPAGVRGLIIGLYAKKKNFEMTPAQTVGICVVSSIAVTTLTTVVMYVDSVIFHYYSAAYVFGAIVPRYITGVLIGAVFATLMPSLLRLIRKNAKS